MEENIKKMLKRMEGEHGVTEITNTKVNLGGLDKYDDIIKRDEDLFFVSFIPVDNYHDFLGRRTKDSFVKGTTYFRADFDIRSSIYENMGVVACDETLMEFLDDIRRGLDQDELLRTYNAIVFSGNGFHVYWIGKETEIDAETYSTAAGELLERIKDIYFKRGRPEIYGDFACSNISRLMRLPGSKNHKKKYGLKPRDVKLLYYSDRDSELVSKLPEIGKKAQEKETERIINTVDLMRAGKKEIYIYDNPVYVAINDKINIAELVCNYTGWKLAENRKNFISNKDGGYTGAYVIPAFNVVVHKGTPHFSDTFPIYSPFAFIQVHYAGGDAKKTFEKVKEMYPDIVKSVLNFDKKIEYGC